jgi:hypothetical protein
MAERIPFPFPCEDVPRFETQHEAATLLAEYQAKSHIKQCAHVRIGTIGAGMIATDYTLKCEKDSFVVEEERYSGSSFHGCPKDCRLYEPAWKGRTKKWLKEHWWPFRRFIVGTAQWYASLSPAAQVILALLLLALVGFPWRDTVLDGLKIVFGK